MVGKTNSSQSASNKVGDVGDGYVPIENAIWNREIPADGSLQILVGLETLEDSVRFFFSAPSQMYIPDIFIPIGKYADGDDLLVNLNGATILRVYVTDSGYTLTFRNDQSYPITITRVISYKEATV